MSCNGCRVLRKGCSETCILRPCLQWIESAEAQGHATLFVAKFFGRAGLTSFISAVPENQRPSLFQSLLFEACGRTVNPVNGAVGLLWTGNWHVCQAAVQTVLNGGSLRPIPEFLGAAAVDSPELDETSEAEVTCSDMFELRRDPKPNPSRSKPHKRKCGDELSKDQPASLGLSLSPCSTVIVSPSMVAGEALGSRSPPEKRRPGTPSMNSEESVTMTCFESCGFPEPFSVGGGAGKPKLLNLFPKSV